LEKRRETKEEMLGLEEVIEEGPKELFIALARGSLDIKG